MNLRQILSGAANPVYQVRYLERLPLGTTYPAIS